ncbi:MAG: hypothetical protein U1D55_19395 [Phycisphaerae bacterium]
MNSAERFARTLVECDNATDRVGALELRVEFAEVTAASEQWKRRADALAAWLMAEWKRDRMEAA